MRSQTGFNLADHGVSGEQDEGVRVFSHHKQGLMNHEIRERGETQQCPVRKLHVLAKSE